jgi:hypothetical protein
MLAVEHPPCVILAVTLHPIVLGAIGNVADFVGPDLALQFARVRVSGRKTFAIMENPARNSWPGRNVVIAANAQKGFARSKARTDFVSQ